MLVASCFFLFFLIGVGNVSSTKQSDVSHNVDPAQISICCELGRPLRNVQGGSAKERRCVKWKSVAERAQAEETE